MRPGSANFAFLFACLIAAVGPDPAAALGHSRDADRGGRFDYYLLSLSWAPTYCLTHPDNADECGARGFGFILHGLWPQNDDGGRPRDCATDRSPSRRTVERALAFMPSRALVEHEWRAHGACSGLEPEQYFGIADRAFSAVSIPPALRAPRRPPQLTAAALKQAFVVANPGLDATMLSVVCRDGAELSEVHVCLDRDTLAPQACRGRVRDRCRYGTLRIPAAR